MNNKIYSINVDAFYRYLAVAKYGSFEKAAIHYHANPSTIVRSMNALEGTLGVKLFYRSPQGVTLTNEGRVFHTYASQFVDDLENIIARLHGEKENGKDRWDHRVIKNLWEMDPKTRSAVVNLTDALASVEQKPAP